MRAAAVVVVALVALIGTSALSGPTNEPIPDRSVATPVPTPQDITPSLLPPPSLETRSQPGDVLRVDGPGLGNLIEAFPGDLLFVAAVIPDDGAAAYLLEGPPRSSSEDASRVKVPATTIDTSTSETEFVCPRPPRAFSELEYLPPFVRALCFEERLTLEDVWVDAPTDAEVDRGPTPEMFLSGYAEIGSGTLPFAAAAGVTVEAHGWVTVTGRFGQADLACGDAFGMLRCRETFNVEQVRAGRSPFSDMSGSWSAMSAAPIDGRSSYVALEIDRGIFVWGGEPAKTATSGAIYDISRDRWSKTTLAPGASRVAPASSWSGSEVLIWGGWLGTRGLADGLAYDPRTERWSKIPSAPIEGGGAIGAWSGAEFVVVSAYAEAAAWDPVAREWRQLPDPPIPEGHVEGVWTGRELIVLGIGEGTQEPVLGAALDVSTSTWRTIADVPYDGLILGIKPVWTDERMLFVGHEYDPATDEWRVLRRDGCIYRSVSDGVWTGSFVINQTQAFDPERGRCYTLPRSPERPGFEGVHMHEFHTPVWADGRLVVWSGGTGLDGPAPPPDGIVFQPDAP